jgi:hypothetical protein
VFKRYKDTLYKLGLVELVVVSFYFISQFISLEISRTPVYQSIYVLANVITIVLVFQIYDFHKNRRNQIIIEITGIRLLQWELRLELLKETMFEKMNMTAEEIKSYNDRESKIENNVSKQHKK